MDIEAIYHSYLVHIESLREQTIEKFHASASGSCYRKQLYSYFNYPQDAKDSKSYRILRLGTIMHEDIENAVARYQDLQEDKDMGEIYIEEKIELSDLNVVGTFDLAESTYWKNGKTKFTLYDIKTAAAYKWTTMFGRVENRKPNSAKNYKLQLGTYALGINEKFNPGKIEMYLLWYNKNTSHMREQPVDPKWMDDALEYWAGLNGWLDDCGKKFEEDLVVGVEGVPFQDWECRYCQYYSICPSDLADKRRF